MAECRAQLWVGKRGGRRLEGGQRASGPGRGLSRQADRADRQAAQPAKCPCPCRDKYVTVNAKSSKQAQPGRKLGKSGSGSSGGRQCMRAFCVWLMGGAYCDARSLCGQQIAGAGEICVGQRWELGRHEARPQMHTAHDDAEEHPSAPCPRQLARPHAPALQAPRWVSHSSVSFRVGLSSGLRITNVLDEIDISIEPSLVGCIRSPERPSCW